MKKTLMTLACALALAGCAQLTPRQPDAITQLRFIGEQRLPWHMQYQGTLVGGLSGIDYDAANDEWVMISDDRSQHNPARYYRAKLGFDQHAFRSVQLSGVTTLLQADGSAYPSKEAYQPGVGEVPDLESMRIDPRDASIWYASEGDVRLGLDPFVRHATRDGRHLASLPLPAMFTVSKQQQSGPRNNQAFEGISFSPDGATLWVSLEGPMYQDGAEPDPQHGAVNRITHFSRDGKVLGQYAYPLDALPAAPAPGMEADNGISEILAVSDTRLLALERAGVQGADGSYRTFVRLYEISLDGASDIQHLPTLNDAAYTPMKKRLVLDLGTLGLPIIDNLEGVAFGPRLGNGHASLMMVSDDNFNKAQVTQFLLFEVLP
ncbi:esterase-like activity of phytase family protein [Duganella sp. sic0402]|uniref:esterase-like activity of phytase family protein n=1 Tax=Duganella sp. sic0402 TaxID=2854786 RepID=UPI001C49630A|nr:esterase-like activity of phytase family protein [Duganella sp. sic0402]MBV7534539.1 esterase-like activity of phytase family protein [Duganella sp. sic0402]